MRCYYIYSRIEEDLETSGEAKKAKMQADALTKNGINTSVLFHNRYIKNNKLLIRIPFLPIYNKKTRKEFVSKIHDADAIYIRKYVIDSSFILFLKEIKHTYPQIKIIFEIPTYPYDREWDSLIDSSLLIKDRIYRKKLCHLVNRIVTFSNDDDIFGVTTIKTSNGIDIDVIPQKANHTKNKKEINLLGVATLEKWHGYDRLIQGIKEYYEKEREVNVAFHIVGGGAEYENLVKLSKSCGTDDHVFFYGPRKGAELNSFFEKADIGIGSLGMSRIGLQDGYTLKLREYMARGLPFIYAYNDALIESCGGDFSLKYLNDESPIDVEKIVDFYSRIVDEDEIGNMMRNIAETRLTWVSQMEPIAKYIKGE